MRIIQLFLHRKVIVVLIFFCVCLLIACAPISVLFPTALPTVMVLPQPLNCSPIVINTGSSPATIQLPDNSLIYIAENTLIDLVVGGYCAGITEHHIVLHQGQVAIQSSLPAGMWFTITNPAGYVVQLNNTGIASFNPDNNLFRIDCTNGNCGLGPNIQQLTQLGCNEGGELDQSGSFTGPLSIDLDAIKAKYGDWVIPLCLPVVSDTPSSIYTISLTPTETPTPTWTITVTPIETHTGISTFTPTRTATKTPNRAATATAYCRIFQNQFPGTPCP